MTYNPQNHHRRSIRLKGYDYSQEGLYFITICTQNRACLFGKIENGKMILNEYGQIACNEWIKTTEIRNNVELCEFVIMPNHIHGIIRLFGRGELHSPHNSAHSPNNSTNSPNKLHSPNELHSPNNSTDAPNELNTPIIRGVCNTPNESNTSNVGVCETSNVGVCDTPNVGVCDTLNVGVCDTRNRGVCDTPLRSPSQTIGQLFGDINRRCQNNWECWGSTVNCGNAIITNTLFVTNNRI